MRLVNEQTLKFCHLYKGEDLCPEEFNNSYKRKIWFSESVVCGKKISSQEDFDNQLCSQICTREPYQGREIVKKFFEDFPAPEYQDKLMKTYEID